MIAISVDNKFGMKHQVFPTHYREPLKPQLRGRVEIHPPGHAEMLLAHRSLDDEFELLPGFESSTSKDLEDTIWSTSSDRSVETQRATNCSGDSADFQVSLKTQY